MNADVSIISDPPALPQRPTHGHKGTFKRVLVVAGSDEMPGAAVLAGLASLKMGAGWVQVATSDRALLIAHTIAPELVGLNLDRPRWRKRLASAATQADAIVLGPGLGQDDRADAIVREVLPFEKRAVIDADALNLLSQRRRWPRKIGLRAVLTPHPGEMLRLGRLFGRDEVPTDEAGRLAIAVEASRVFQQIVLLKGNRTVITDGTRAYINTTGDSSLSKAGTGDVLSGMLGTLLAQMEDPFDAACLAAHLHGRAGEIAGQASDPRSVLARDVIDELPRAFAQAHHD